jgi:MFS family permease
MYFYLLVASLIANFADSLFGPLYAVYVQEIGGNLLDVGYTVALYSIATGILIVLFGKLSDHYSKELFATIGFAISALGTLGYVFIETPIQLYVLQLVFALSTALLTAPFSALMAKYIDEKKAGLLWALESGGSKILFGFGLMLGTYITYTFGFITVFLIIFLFQVISTFLLFYLWILSKKKIKQWFV